MDDKIKNIFVSKGIYLRKPSCVVPFNLLSVTNHIARTSVTVQLKPVLWTSFLKCSGMKARVLLLVAMAPLFTHAQLSPKMVHTSNGPVGFYEFKPPGYNPDSTYKYPLIIFMHGVGERGNGTTDLPLLLTASFPKLFVEHATMKFVVNGRQHAFVVLLPQMSKDYVNWQKFYIDAMIDYAKGNMRIDENKIFLSGWSLGGGGAWKYATALPDSTHKIAGIIPVSPAPNYTELCNIKKDGIAVWAHHAKRDTYIPTTYTDYAIKIINACSPGTPGIPALVTYYPSGGHNFVADYAYDTLNHYQYPNMFQWMIGVSRASTPENNKPPVPVAGNDTSILLPHVKTVLNGMASYDPNDVIVQYTWSMLSGPASPGLKLGRPDFPVTSVEGLEPGKYIFRLRVKDEFGIIRNDDVAVHVTLPPSGLNAVPLVDAGPDITTTSTNYHICGNARDFDGTINRYKWRQVSGPASLTVLGRGNMADVVGMTALGTYGLELTAYDNHSPSGSGKDTLMITKTTFSPVLVFYWTTNLGDLNLGKHINFFVLFIFFIASVVPVSFFMYRNR